MTDLGAGDAPLCCHKFHPLRVGKAGGQLVWGLSCQVWRVVPCLLLDLMA